MRPLLTALVLLAPSIAWSADAATPATPADVAAWRAARERFAERADEIRADALRTLEAQRTAQLAGLKKSFDAQAVSAAAQETALRGEAVAEFESFLRRYDDVGATSEVRLRLAELYYREAEDLWLESSRTYFEALDAAETDLDALSRLEAQGEPRIDLARVVGLLNEVVAVNRGVDASQRYELLDVVYYMLAFAFAEPNSVQYDAAKARDVFRELIATRPDSDFADAAHLMLGNYLFEENRYADSIPEFEAVLAQGETRRSYDAALYQLSWARYKLSEYDPAMKGFVELLTRSEANRGTHGRVSEFAPDAITYLALSLLDRSDRDGTTPLDEAARWFAGNAPTVPWRWDVYRSLAEALVTYGRPRDAVAIYRQLLDDPAWVLRPENPDFQDTIVKLLSRGYDADLSAAGQARIDMTERFGEGSVWWDANRADPEALARARRYTEAYLLDVAVEVKVRAQESGDPAAYALAADKYREYLDRFPIGDDYYENEFQLADALYRAERYEDSADAYGNLLRSSRFHKFGDAAVFMVFRSRDQLLRSRVGDPDKRSPNAEIERTVTSVGGNDIAVYELLDDQKAFIDAADGVVGHTFGEPVDGVDVAQLARENRSKILYLPAQILYNANRFEEARPRLQKVIKEHPDTDEATFAASLFLNTYVAEGDSDAIRRWSREFAGMRLGPSKSAANASQFQDTYEKSSYQLGADAYAKNDFAGAAAAYLSFVSEFPKSKYVPDAMLSAAFNYDRLGRASDANALYERFLREYPTHPDAKPFYFRIASNYESVFELGKATGYYRQFVERYPKDPEARNAQYMVAFLEEGLGKNLEAARGYEDYAKKYPEAEDREDVHYRAGKMYELSDADRAITFYRAYLKSYGTQNPDHAISAQGRIAALLTQQGKTREASTARDDVVKLFDRIVAADGKVGPAGRDAAAAAAFPALQARYDAIAARKLSRNEAKDTKLLLDELPPEIKALDDAASAFVERYLSFEYTTAAIYLQGAARSAYAKLGFGVQPPANLDEDSQSAYWELLEETLFPQMRGVEEQAISTYQKVLDLAAQQKRHAVWVDRSREGMAAIDPATYPTPKQPLLGAIQAVEPARIAPSTGVEESP